MLKVLKRCATLKEQLETFDTTPAQCGSMEIAEIDVCHFHHIHIRGDQLPEVPIAEDCHTMFTLHGLC